MAPANERARAARLLLEIVHQGQTTDQSFGNQIVTPLVSELVYGALRHYYSLSALLDEHLSRDFRTKDLDLRFLMLVGAYQLYYTRIPAHAVVHETVNACRALRKPWAAKLVNAVLRKLTETPLPDQTRPADESVTERSVELPFWLIQRLQGQYLSRAPALMQAFLERAPMSLRVNVQKTSVAEYSMALDRAGLSHHSGWLPENLVLDAPVAGRNLPGLETGLVSVQDSGAMFTPNILRAAGLQSGNSRPSILDACAAPGGKLFHLAESMPEATLTAIEQSALRFEHMSDEAMRLGHTHLQLLQGNATEQSWWSGVPYDAVLLDAPCSGTGTLRRHPDIKILRQPEDLTGYSALQGKLLTNLWQTLKPGGVLVYCTCSVLEEENDGVLDSFLKGSPEARVLRFDLPTGVATRHGWQLLPCTTSAAPDPPITTVDGFYYACLSRPSKAGKMRPQ